jgi:hypothetical protein
MVESLRGSTFAALSINCATESLSQPLQRDNPLLQTPKDTNDRMILLPLYNHSGVFIPDKYHNLYILYSNSLSKTSDF